jgi:hypothetical protein
MSGSSSDSGRRPDMSGSSSDSGRRNGISADTLDVARQVADAVLYEGYVLFPYRASALKNRYRWQWGVVIPQAQVDVGGGEPSEVCCETLVRVGDGTQVGSPPTTALARVDVTARFLQLRLRQMIDAEGRPVDELDVDGEPVPTWEEGMEHEVTVTVNLGEGGRQAAGGRGSSLGEGGRQAAGGRGSSLGEGGRQAAGGRASDPGGRERAEVGLGVGGSRRGGGARAASSCGRGVRSPRRWRAPATRCERRSRCKGR